MPQLGETVVEGTITKWLKKEGESVERDEPLFEISTDKVDTEVPSPLAGQLVEIKVQVGTELAMIDTGGDGQAARAEAPPRAEEETQVQEATPSESGTGQAAEPERKEPEREEAKRAEAPPPEEKAPPAVAPAPSGEGGPRSHILSPLVRRLAEENEVDLAQVRGTGTEGRITKNDVLSFVESKREAPAPAAAQPS